MATPIVPEMREFGDPIATRDATHRQVLQSLEQLPDVEHQNHVLRLREPHFIDPEQLSRRDEFNALLQGQTLGRRIRGTWELLDKDSGSVLDSRTQVIGRVPYLTDLGVYIHNGNQYSLGNQQRMLPGSFTRRRKNEELEAHINVLPGKGLSHHYGLDPDRGVFQLRALQAKIPLMPVLRAMGATDHQLREAWGDEILQRNLSVGEDGYAMKRVADRFLKAQEREGPEHEQRAKIRAAFERMELDPEVTRRTLGTPHKNVNLQMMIDTTSKMLRVARGEQDPDDRDHLAYQRVMGPEDLMAERAGRDLGGVRRKLLWKFAKEGNLSKMPSGVLTPQLEASLLHSGLGQALEEVNAGEILDKNTRISRMGEGGIGSLDAVPDEARALHSSHLGFLDPVKVPESSRIGVDTYLARGARKGADGKLYAQFRNVRTGQLEWKTPQELADVPVAQPGALNSKTRRVQAISGGRERYVPRNQVAYELPSFEDTFSPLSNLIPFKSAAKGNRASMGARMTTQALPLTNAEAPLVQAGIPGTRHTKSYDQLYGERMGAIRAKQAGTVEAADGEQITLRHQDGTTSAHPLYQHWPFNRKTFFHQESVVRPGQVVRPGDLLARSNYTDKEGQVALGMNARVAYIPWGGFPYEDATVISESMAKRGQSEHLYQHEAELDERTQLDKRKYIGLFPAKYNRSTLDALDERGVVKPGATVHFGDPLVLLSQQRDLSGSRVHKRKQAGWKDASLTWQHHDPGVVTEVADGKSGPAVFVKSLAQTQVGDKLSGRFGDKHIVAAVLPDDQMPHDQDGQPYEIAVSPQGITSRGNPAQAVEAGLGKIAARTGQPYRVADFEDIDDLNAFTQQELRRHGLESHEVVVDPQTGRRIPGILTGNRYYMKLGHQGESKGQGRALGSYTMEGAPAKGGQEGGGSKRMAMLDINALMSHGAHEVTRDAIRVRGQANPDHWLQYLQGYTPAEAKIPVMYEKAVHQLQASGINVIPSEGRLQVMAMTDGDVEHLAGDRELTSAETMSMKGGELKPIPGGLFDPTLTGGAEGRRWSKITLHEPLPNPVMEEPIRRLLGLTKNRFESVLSGTEDLGGHKGPGAIGAALAKLNLPLEIAKSRVQVSQSRGNKRDDAVRRLDYLRSAQRLDQHPQDWLLKAVPVLPPAFRPIAVMSGNRLPLVADANLLYRDLFQSNRNLKELQGHLGEEGVGEERLQLYKSLKAVTGLGEPTNRKSQEKGLKGILKSVFGSSPKFGMVQRKLLSSPVDMVGRAVVVPNPDYDMDSIGIPEQKAFDVYRLPVARELKRRGMPLRSALQHVEQKTSLARDTLLDIMKEYPVVMHRAPVLHKFGIMAFWPKLVKGNAMQVSPLIVSGFGMDFDGDQANYHVPMTEGAQKQAIEKLLPSRSLLHPNDFRTPVHQLRQDYLAGVHEATRPDPKKRARVMATKQHVLEALRRGELGLTDPVEILQPD